MSIELRVAGKRLTHFMRGSVQFSMQEVFNSFDVQYSALGKEMSDRLIETGDALELWLDDELLISGYVDSIDDEDGDSEVRLRAVGRSVTLDVADCSAEHLSFTNAKASVIAARIVKPYGIAVRLEGDEGAPFPAFSVQQGETCLDAITRLCTKRGLYPYSIGRELVLGRAGALATATRLVRGERPLLRSSRSSSWYGRYSEYVFRGQVPATDSAWGKKANHLKHAVRDPAITRHRPLLLHAEAHAPGDLKTRAEVERNQRAGQGERILATVEGHRTAEGRVWRPNLLVPFRNPVLRVDATLLATVVRLRFGEREQEVAELELTRPEAFDIVAYPAMTRGKPWT
jgi:prophage tail gpP-like protein